MSKYLALVSQPNEYFFRQDLGEKFGTINSNILVPTNSKSMQTRCNNLKDVKDYKYPSKQKKKCYKIKAIKLKLYKTILPTFFHPLLSLNLHIYTTKCLVIV